MYEIFHLSLPLAQQLYPILSEKYDERGVTGAANVKNFMKSQKKL